MAAHASWKPMGEDLTSSRNEPPYQQNNHVEQNKVANERKSTHLPLRAPPRVPPRRQSREERKVAAAFSNGTLGTTATTNPSVSSTTNTQKRLQRLRRLSSKGMKLSHPSISKAKPVHSPKKNPTALRPVSSIREIHKQIHEQSLENKRLRAKIRALECQLDAMEHIKSVNRDKAEMFLQKNRKSEMAQMEELRIRAELAEKKLMNSQMLASKDVSNRIRKLELRIVELEELNQKLAGRTVPSHHVAVLPQTKKSHVEKQQSSDVEAYVSTIARLEVELRSAERQIQEQNDELIAWRVASMEQQDDQGFVRQNVEALSPSAGGYRGGARLSPELRELLAYEATYPSNNTHQPAPPVISSGNSTMHSGYLLKCSRLLKNWQRRFFVYYKQEGVLNYFGTQGGTQKGAVSLRHSGTQVERAEDVLQIASTEAIHSIPKNVQKSPWLHLRVVSPAYEGSRARVMWLAATCEEDRDIWIEALS